MHFQYVYVVNCNRAAYLNLILEGGIKIVKALNLAMPHALSQYTCHGNSIIEPSV
jgi:hypothetical protein